MMEPAREETQAVESLGAELRRQRELRGISLKEIADASKISKRYLEAIENDHYEVLPAPVFTRGFVREYAKAIGLNADEMMARYSEIVRRAEAVDPASGEFPAPAGKAMPFVRIDRNLAMFALLLAVFLGVMWWIARGGSREVGQPPPTDTVEPAVAPAVPSEAVVSSTAPASSPDRLELELRVVDDTWVILNVDGQTSLNQVLRRGELRKLQAENEFRFEVIGNAGGIELTLNGTKLQPLGPPGKVIRGQVFDWDTVKKGTNSP